MKLMYEWLTFKKLDQTSDSQPCFWAYLEDSHLLENIQVKLI